MIDYLVQGNLQIKLLLLLFFNHKIGIITTAKIIINNQIHVQITL